MKYCTRCGNELDDDAAICLKCGCMTSDFKVKKKKAVVRSETNEYAGENKASSMIFYDIIPLVLGACSLIYALSAFTAFFTHSAFFGVLNELFDRLAFGAYGVPAIITGIYRCKSKSIMPVLGIVFGVASVVLLFVWMVASSGAATSR